MKLETKRWIRDIKGQSQEWANFPEPMKLDAPNTPGEHLLILAHLSRVEHSHPDVNTEFRIMVGENQAATASTGNAAGCSYRDISFHAASGVGLNETDIRVEVEYKTQEGEVFWRENGTGPQERKLTILRF